MSKLRVVVCCTGVGIFNRGIESFYRELFDGLLAYSLLDVHLLKGQGEESEREHVVKCFPRTGRLAEIAGKAIRRNAYVVEQLSSFPSVIGHLRKLNPALVITSDANLMYRIHTLKKKLGLSSLKIVFSNGGPCHPPFRRTDFVHQVAPHYYDEAVEYGEPPNKHHLVPYGISVPDRPPYVSEEETAGLRKKLKIPENQKVILSVGWISSRHKRMDYVIKEVAAMSGPLPYLIMLGAMDETSAPIVSLAKELLGDDGFCARSVPYNEVFDYYKTADVFVLASLREGFGRVYLEALMHGLPTIAHDHPVMKYVLGEMGSILNMGKNTTLSEHLQEMLADKEVFSAENAMRRYEYVKSTFSWEALVPAYVDMFNQFNQTRPEWNT